jgi:hypothetical protein
VRVELVDFISVPTRGAARAVGWNQVLGLPLIAPRFGRLLTLALAAGAGNDSLQAGLRRCAAVPGNPPATFQALRSFITPRLVCFEHCRQI